MRERIAQLREEIEGLVAQQDSRRRELRFAKDELVGLDELEGKNLVSTPRMTAARRTVAQLEGDIAQVMSTTAQSKGKISEIELQILQLDQDLKTEVGKELRDQQGREAELTERRVAAEDQLKRIDIRSPQSGTVHQLNVHTVGGVIAPSEQIMLIVPECGSARDRRQSRAAGHRPGSRRATRARALLGLQPAYHAGPDGNRQSRICGPFDGAGAGWRARFGRAAFPITAYASL